MAKEILEECKALRDFFVIDLSDKLKEIEKELNDKYQLREKQKIELCIWIDEEDRTKVNVSGISTKLDGTLTQMDMFFNLK